MNTIVQHYGPFYGEAVNGTVQGRPNGSIYVPATNKIVASLPTGVTVIDKYTAPDGTNYLVLSRALKVVADSQDPTSYIYIAVYTDSACTTRFGSARIVTPGVFNATNTVVGFSAVDPTAGVSYYIKAELCNNGTAIAASDVIEVTGYDGE